MFCKNCGKENPDTGRFCIECGAPMVREAVNPDPFNSGKPTPIGYDQSIYQHRTVPPAAPATPQYQQSSYQNCTVPPAAPATPQYQQGSYQNCTVPPAVPGMPATNINVQIPPPQKNSFGTAGFVLSVISIFLGMIPLLGQVLWLLGTIFSVMGLFKTPKGLAIAGTVISCCVLVLIIWIYATGSPLAPSHSEYYTYRYSM
ncbi:hypothetical protein Corgl_1525 [Coriobacterium glomerans PW2]|uniref:Zinc-ribbon domain-containing protein n=1 Tax=Coriobacterium glomerans (strain ATCC 49209 / DSM 20642 / JCM 10262 / PW2) TaxID=700015 RepID=F2NAU6_CORGP|nr:zinc ribbon domain-containing protein [Coriobacterium glomerans]AEB07624.1 hypothetical protein Corgl_1525 [Coriobacterium glomerans PW2]